MLSLRQLAWAQTDDPALHDAEIDAKITALSQRDFGNTCFDYIAAIVRIGEQYGVTVFIEPAGPVFPEGSFALSALVRRRLQVAVPAAS